MVQVSFTYWLAAAGLVVLLALSAMLNLCLRTRSIVAVAEKFRRVGRENELRWVIDHREDLILATATIRTAAALALLLVILELVELQGALSPWRDVAAFLVAFFVVLIVGVGVPSALAKYSAGTVVGATLPLLRVLRPVVAPFLRFLDAIDSIVRRLLGAAPRNGETCATDVEQEILNIVSEGKLQGAFDAQEQEMLESVIQFGDIDTGNIMTPRTDIVAIDKNATMHDAIELIRKEGHSRIPIYDETIDNVLGVLYAKDLLLIDPNESFDLTGIMRAVPFVPDNKPVDDLLEEFKDRKVHMAIVLDEYGGTSGLVTIEDIIEELVGEIADEYEAPEAVMLKRIDDRVVEVDARMRVDDLNDELDISLPLHDDYETVGGLVFSKLGHIPKTGEQCHHDNVEIRVIAAEPRRINRVRLEIVSSTEDERTDQNGRPT